MTESSQSDERRSEGETSTIPQTLTREQLYDLVWREPMLRIGERYRVSSSYLARVCTELRVPRPQPGHWAKLEFGKPSPQRALPAPRPGDALSWTRADPPQPGLRLPGAGSQKVSAPPVTGSEAPAGQTSSGRVEEPASKADAEPAATAKPAEVPSTPKEAPEATRRRGKRIPADARHELVKNVRHHFLKTRGDGTGLLVPFKRILVDIVVSEGLLDDTLDLANQLYLKFASRGHHVTIPSPLPNPRPYRMEVDEREVPKKHENGWRRAVWGPDRPTIAYVDGVPFGLTIFEMTAEVEMLYVHGDYLPVSTLTSAQRSRYTGPRHWTTYKPQLTGRRCLQVYCARGIFKWTRQWRENKPGQLARQLSEVVSALEAAVPEVRRGVEAAEVQAAEEQRKRDAEWAEYERKRKLEREAKARAEARTDLLTAIAAWEEFRRISDYFDAAERQAQNLDEDSRRKLADRLALARALVGKLDPLELLAQWEAPEERLANKSFW